MIAINFGIRHRQLTHRQRHGLPAPPPGILFTEAIDGRRFDESLRTGLKVAFNYAFYKFGYELTLIFAIFTVFIRMDAMAALLVCWVFVFSLCGRTLCRVLWPIFVTYLALTVCLQYALGLGLMRKWCIRTLTRATFLIYWKQCRACFLAYPWDRVMPRSEKTGPNYLQDNFDYIINLANYHHYEFRGILLDFFLLVLVSEDKKKHTLNFR